LDFLDPRFNATGPNPVAIATIPFRGKWRGFLRNPVFRRFASRRGNLSLSGANISGDHSISFGVGFCVTLGYSAQHARPDARRLRR
jgi:hypothetical protein